MVSKLTRSLGWTFRQFTEYDEVRVRISEDVPFGQSTVLNGEEVVAAQEGKSGS